jgi:hypothetical protein
MTKTQIMKVTILSFLMPDGVCNPVRNVLAHVSYAGRGLQPRPQRFSSRKEA